MNDSPKNQGSKKQGKNVARRDEIIREAALLFLDSGYRGASMETLAERVGIAKPTLYHYFKRKEDILYEIHKLFVLPLLEQQQLYADRRLPPDDQLRRAIRDMLAAMREDPSYIRSVIEHGRELGEERDREFRDISRKHRLLLEDAVRDGIAMGMFRDVDPIIAAYAVLGVASWAAYWFRPGAEMTADDVAETLADIVLNGLRAY